LQSKKQTREDEYKNKMIRYKNEEKQQQKVKRNDIIVNKDTSFDQQLVKCLIY
jgi:hypothetical protein